MARRLELRVVETPDDWRALHNIRRTVLFAPGRHDEAYDDSRPDERAPGNTSFLFLKNGLPVGTVRLDVRGDIGIVRLVAIVASEQRQGWGRAMSALVEADAARRGVSVLRVNAAADAVGFYAKLGWTQAGWDPSELVGIARRCVQMQKRINIPS